MRPQILLFLLIAIAMPPDASPFQKRSKYQQPPKRQSSFSSHSSLPSSCLIEMTRLDKCRQDLPTKVVVGSPSTFQEIQTLHQVFWKCMGDTSCSDVKLQLKAIESRYTVMEKLSSIFDCAEYVLEDAAHHCNYKIDIECQLEYFKKNSDCSPEQLVQFEGAIDAFKAYYNFVKLINKNLINNKK